MLLVLFGYAGITSSVVFGSQPFVARRLPEYVKYVDRKQGPTRIYEETF